jgi:hypothetical protein
MNTTKTGVCHIAVEMSGDYGIELEAEIVARYTYYPFCPGDRDTRYGPNISPDEPAHIDVESAILKVKDKIVAGVNLEMLDAESIEEACWEHAMAS